MATRYYGSNISLWGWGTLSLLCLAVSVILGSAWEYRLQTCTPSILLMGAGPGSASAGLKSRSGATPSSHVYQRIRETGGGIHADYGFLNFNDDPLTIAFSIASRELSAYKQDYGYTPGEKAAIDNWLKSANEEAYHYAVRQKQSQEQLNQASERINADYKAKLAAFYTSRGFSIMGSNLMVVNIPEIVRRNVKKVRSLALSINSAGEKHGYDSDSIITAALSFVQTAILYENVPMEIRGKQTGGIYPPLETVALGKGDCDTKAALLGAVLLNWDKIRLVGIGVPGHYLMGVLRNPAKGDAFVEYKGMRYVLVEPAGPAWLPPGTIDRNSLALLNARKNLRIEQFSAN